MTAKKATPKRKSRANPDHGGDFRVLFWTNGWNRYPSIMTNTYKTVEGAKRACARKLAEHGVTRCVITEDQCVVKRKVEVDIECVCKKNKGTKTDA